MASRFSFSIDFVKNLVSNYGTQRATMINSGGSEFYDSRSVWFSYNDLQSFLSLMSANSEEDPNTLGVRVYFGVYPEILPDDGTCDMELTQNYAGLQTVLLVPTINNNDFNPYVYDINNPENSYIVNSSDADVIMAMNHGGLIPPPPEAMIDKITYAASVSGSGAGLLEISGS